MHPYEDPQAAMDFALSEQPRNSSEVLAGERGGEVTVIIRGHPREPETFEFSETQRWHDGLEAGKHLRVIKSHVAYDSRWPWWRRLWANMRGRP